MKHRLTTESVAAVCGVLVLLVAATAAGARGDDEVCAASEALRPYIDPAVRYHRRPVADDDNAYPLVIEATRLEAMDADPAACFHDGGSTYHAEWPEVVRGADTNCIERALDANAPALEVFDRALARPDLQSPLLRLPLELPNFAPMRRLAILKLERAKARLRAGDSQGAIQDLQGLLRYARLFEAGDGGLIHLLVGVAIDGFAMAGARAYAAHPNADEPSLNALLESVVLNEHNLSAVTAQAWQVEFNCVAVRVAEQVFNDGVGLPGGIPEWFFGTGSESARAGRIVFAGHPNALDPRETLQLASERVAAMVEAAQKDVGRPVTDLDAKLRVELAAWPDRWNISVRAARKVRAEMAAVDNPVGKWWALQEVSPWWTYLDNVSLFRAIARGTSTLLALRLYELRTGELPATLTDLVSEGILATPPVDPYSGRPLGYHKIARAVWSVGPEEGPNGGAGCGLGGQRCRWSLPDAFGDRTTLPSPPCVPADAAAAPGKPSGGCR
jgi:hypothetical protein